MFCTVIPYYSLFVCDILVNVLRMEISHKSEAQLVRVATHYDITMGNEIARGTIKIVYYYFVNIKLNVE